MWMTGRPKTELRVSAEDRATRGRWTARRKTAQGLALRSRIVLGCASGLSNIAVARKLGIADQTVCKWRGRFVNKGVSGLLDEPRSGVPRKITDDQVEAMIVKTLESTPRDATRSGGAAHIRLQTPRHHVVVCRARCCERQGDWRTASATSLDRVPQVPRSD